MLLSGTGCWVRRALAHEETHPARCGTTTCCWQVAQAMDGMDGMDGMENEKEGSARGPRCWWLLFVEQLGKALRSR